MKPRCCRMFCFRKATGYLPIIGTIKETRMYYCSKKKHGALAERVIKGYIKIKQMGKPAIQFEQYINGSWILIVNSKLLLPGFKARILGEGREEERQTILSHYGIT